MVICLSHKAYRRSDASFEIFKRFHREPYCFFLDSSLCAGAAGRFSFIGFDPFEIFESKSKHALADLKKRFEKYARLYRKTAEETKIPLPSGIVGYFGYDLGFQLEKIKRRHPDDLGIPDCFFGFYDAVIAIDHRYGRLYVVSTGLPETNRYLQKKKAEYKLEKILKKLSAHPEKGLLSPQNEESGEVAGPVSNFTGESYRQAALKALDYIGRGDIYQVNLAQRFTVDLKEAGGLVDPVAVYGALRASSPCPYGAYFDAGGFRILSASPERFLALENRTVITRPMKGTRPRGNSPQEDKRLQKELMHSKKEKAELLMITDLERNDLGRVCEYGSVKVGSLRALEKYKTVFQTTATVRGVLRSDKDSFDLIKASFPGGSVTGCPKIRAMEIIEELESVRRSFYTGSLGYISFSGRMDLNVLIRSLLYKDDKLYFYAGSGIVADSNPEREYEETLIKSKALQDILKQSALWAGQT